METKQKIWLGVGGVALVGTTAFFINRAVKKNRRTRQQSDTVNSSSSAVDAILKANTKLPPELRQIPSYTTAQMKAFADSLEMAMKGAGTNEKTVKAIFQRLNHDLDVMLLIEAFGVRGDENLASWLEDDGMVAEVNQILDTKGRVTFRF
jgi:hypothetical protein